MDKPNNLKKRIKKKEHDEKREKERELREEKERELALKKHLESEKRDFPKKLEFSRKIFSWGDDFLKTSESKKILKRSYGDIEVFYGGWAHTLPRYGDSGCWSRIELTKKGVSYKSGYKWMGFRCCFDFKKPEEMAKNLNYDYLKQLWDSIDKGKVWKRIEDGIKDY